jgi:hypothetical protein
MNADIFIYEAAVLLLAACAACAGIVMFKLTRIAQQKSLLWLWPFAACLLLLVSVGAHAYASFKLIPQLGTYIQMLSSEEVIFDQSKLNAAKTSITSIKSMLIALKALSFTLFFAAAVMMFLAILAYIKKLSK